MSVLVTGGAGYIGGHMALGLLDAGETVVVLDNLSTGFAWAVPEGAKLVVGDTGDADLVAGLIKEHAIDAIAHFAAKIVVPESVRDPLGYYLNNVSNARTLIETAIKGGVKTFIFSSTAAVYGETSAEPVSEEAALAPISPYGRSKLMVEWMLEDASRAYDFRYVALRYFNVAGADPKGRLGQSTPNATHLIKRAVQTALGVHREDGDLRPGLSDPRRHLRARLYPGHRPHRRASRRAGLSARGRRQRRLQLRLRTRGRRSRRWLTWSNGCRASIFRSSCPDGAPAIRPPSSPRPDRVKSVLGWKPTRDNLDEIVRQALDWERRLHNRRADGSA